MIGNACSAGSRFAVHANCERTVTLDSSAVRLVSRRAISVGRRFSSPSNRTVQARTSSSRCSISSRASGSDNPPLACSAQRASSADADGRFRESAWLAVESSPGRGVRPTGDGRGAPASRSCATARRRAAGSWNRAGRRRARRLGMVSLPGSRCDRCGRWCGPNRRRDRDGRCAGRASRRRRSPRRVPRSGRWAQTRCRWPAAGRRLARAVNVEPLRRSLCQ